MASDRTFDDAWDAWLEERMGEGDGVLVRAMACDLKLDALEAAARTVVKERDILGREEKAPPFGVDSLLDRTRAAVATLRPLKARCLDREDDAFQAVLELEADLARAERLDPASREQLFRALGVVAHKGRQESWKTKEDCKATKAELKAVKEAQAAYLAASSAHLAWALRDRLRGFLAAYERAKADAAVVDFQDLLLRARDVLQSSIPVRRYFQRRFDFVLVDEFQDTDPLQAEIAFFLAEDPEGEPAGDWRGCRLKPGKLFVVGDPKQSIYRFRRADIAVYEEAKRLVERSGGETLALTTNFRTVPSIVSFVNERFGEVFADREIDPDPRPLVAFRDEVDKGGARTLALAVPPERLPEDGDRKVGAIVPLVAATVAAFLDDITRQRPWSVRDGDAVRPARPGDVALLVRRMSPDFIEHYERAFARQGVPFRLVGGKDYYARDEVRALANVLRAVDNPADRLSVFAALRSPFFGFSDDDLWQLVAKGGALNYLAPVPPASGAPPPSPPPSSSSRASTACAACAPRPTSSCASSRRPGRSPRTASAPRATSSWRTCGRPSTSRGPTRPPAPRRSAPSSASSRRRPRAGRRRATRRWATRPARRSRSSPCTRPRASSTRSSSSATSSTASLPRRSPSCATRRDAAG